MTSKRTGSIGVDTVACVPVLLCQKAKSVGVINASALGMGLLTPEGPPSWHPAPQGLRNACASAVAACASQGKDVSALAIAQSLRETRVATTLVGMCTPDMVRRNASIVNAAFAEGAAAGDAKVVEALLPIWQQAGPATCTTWQSGLPQNNE